MKRYFLLLSTTVFVSVLCFGVAMGAGKNYALLIGINKYSHNNEQGDARRNEEGEEWYRLSELLYCAADMKGLGAALTAGNPAFEKNITLLTSDSEDEYEKPTLGNINRFLDDVLPTLNPADTVLIAFAGHGISLPARKGDSDFDQYLCPMDAEVACVDGRYKVNTLISRAKLDRKLLNSPARVKVMIIDACRSLPEHGDRDLKVATRNIGGIGQTIAAPMDIKSFNAGESSKAVGLFLMESCSSNQKAIESPDYGHGIYTYHLIKGLQGAADGFRGTKKGKITLGELNAYVRERTIADVANKHQNLTQEPVYSMLQSNGEDFVIAYCKIPELPSVPTTSSVRTDRAASGVPFIASPSSPIGSQGNNFGNFNQGGYDSGRPGNTGRSSGQNSGTRSYAGGGSRLPK